MPRPVVSPVIGRVLRALFAAIMLVRRPRPIHADGVVLRGMLRRLPGRVRTGIRWIDDGPSEEPVLARASRSAGFPPPWPDFTGLALRFAGDGGEPADLELASTGFAFPSRFWLIPHQSPSRARLGTLLPYRTPSGPLLICARTISPDDLPVAMHDLAGRLEDEPWRLRFYTASPRGKWRPFAEAELRRAEGPLDAPLRFDAVRHPLPGTAQYAWVEAVRQPSYELSQGPGDPDPTRVDGYSSTA